MSKLRLAGVIKESIVDGPGIRFVVFGQGCPHRCPGCQNPQTHDFSGGYDTTTERLLAEIRKNPMLKGITLSGGDPFVQPEAMAELAEEALKDLISPNAEKEVTPELIIQVVADHFGITPLDISSQKRNKEIVFPRQIVMYICRSMLGPSLQNIGKYLGGRDHTTIIHGHDKIAADMEKNESLRNTVEILMKKISPQ